MEDRLWHHGVKGMKWGVRRYQNPDGTLTNAGKARYLDGPSRLKVSDRKIRKERTALTKSASKALKSQWTEQLSDLTKKRSDFKKSSAKKLKAEKSTKSKIERKSSKKEIANISKQMRRDQKDLKTAIKNSTLIGQSEANIYLEGKYGVKRMSYIRQVDERDAARARRAVGAALFAVGALPFVANETLKNY